MPDKDICRISTRNAAERETERYPEGQRLRETKILNRNQEEHYASLSYYNHSMLHKAKEDPFEQVGLIGQN